MPSTRIVSHIKWKYFSCREKIKSQKLVRDAHWGYSVTLHSLRWADDVSVDNTYKTRSVGQNLVRASETQYSLEIECIINFKQAPSVCVNNSRWIIHDSILHYSFRRGEPLWLIEGQIKPV